MPGYGFAFANAFRYPVCSVYPEGGIPVIRLASVAIFAVLPVLAAPDVPASSSAVTFNKDVLPILEKNCQGCHRPGEIAPMSLLTYKDARPWAKSIRDKVANREMPPWHADPKHGEWLNERSLKQTEIDTIAKWGDTGAPEGEAKDAPPPIRWA